MPALCAAAGSFHVKSPTTYFVMVFVMVRVLPFFLISCCIGSVTFSMSVLGGRSYSDQRYSSIQMSATRHSSGASTACTTGFGYWYTESGLGMAASCTGVSGGDAGRESGEGVAKI